MKLQPSLLAITLASVISPNLLADDNVTVTSLKKLVIVEQQKSANTIDSTIIDLQGINNISDTVRYMPGVTVSGTGNRFGDDGFNIRGMDSDSVAITLDGLSQGESLNPINFSRYGMYSSTRNAIEIESVKKIEILKGANSIFAGSGALGGAVLYTTKEASDYLTESGDDTAGSLKSSYDSRNSEKVLSFTGANRSDKVESLLVFTARKANETKSHSDGAEIEGSGRGRANPLDNDKKNVLIKVAYNISDVQRLGVVFEDFSSETLGTPLSRQSTSYYDFTTNDQSNRDRLGVFYEYAGATAVFDTLSLTADKQSIFTSGVTAFSYASRSGDYLRTEDRNYQQDSTVISADFTKLIGSGDITHHLSYGLSHTQSNVVNSLQDIRYNGLTSDTGLRDGYPITDSSWVPKTDTSTNTLYLHDSISVSDKLSIDAGLRYDSTDYDPNIDESFNGNATEISPSSFSAVTGILAASYDIDANNRISASIGSGFKAPTTQELYLGTNDAKTFNGADRVVDPTTGSVSYASNGLTAADLNTISNPNLKAEKGLNLEIAYQWQSENVKIKVAAFQSKYQDMIVNVEHSKDLATPINTASLNYRDAACYAPVLTDSCWITDSITQDTWFVPENIDSATINGIELEAIFTLTEQLQTSVAYSHLSGEKDSVIEESIAPDSAVVGLDFISQNRDWGLNAYAAYTAKKQAVIDDSLRVAKASTVVDVNAWYKITDALTIRGQVSNLLDKKYQQWNTVRYVREGTGGFFGGVSDNGLDRYTMPGRAASINISYAF